MRDEQEMLHNAHESASKAALAHAPSELVHVHHFALDMESHTPAAIARSFLNLSLSALPLFKRLLRALQPPSP